MNKRPHIHRILFRIASALSAIALIASVFMLIKMHERDAYMRAFLHSSLDQQNARNLDDTVLTIARSIYAITNNDDGVEAKSMDWYEDLESRYFFNMTSTVALKYGTYGVRGHYVFGPCGTMSRLLMNSLWDLHIPARKLQLLNNADGKGGGHTLVEYRDGDKWKVIAVSDSAFVWRNHAGDIASVQEIQSEAGVFNQIYAQEPSYPYLFDNAQHLNWTKVPVWIQSLLRATIGQSGMQNIETPMIYDRPRHLLFYLCLGVFIVSTVVSLQLRERIRRHSEVVTLRASVEALHRSSYCVSVDIQKRLTMHRQLRQETRQTLHHSA